MNPRNVTIWTTGVMIIGTMYVPFVLIADDLNMVLESSIFWFFGALPLLVSFVLSGKIKNYSSAIVLLVSAIAFGFWFGFVHIPVVWS